MAFLRHHFSMLTLGLFCCCCCVNRALFHIFGGVWVEVRHNLFVSCLSKSLCLINVGF